MALSLNELTDIDYKILEYIAKFDSVSEDSILNYFPNVESLGYRLEQLAKPDYHHSNPGILFTLPNTSYIEEEFNSHKRDGGQIVQISKNSYHITNLGRKTLQDYLDKKRKCSRFIFFDRLRYTVTTTIAVAALIVGIIALFR